MYCKIESDSISIHRQMPVSAYIGYLSTWSAWQKYKDVHKDTKELEELHKKLVHCILFIAQLVITELGHTTIMAWLPFLSWNFTKDGHFPIITFKIVPL